MLSLFSFLQMRKRSPTVIQWIVPGPTSKNGRIRNKNHADAFLVGLKYLNCSSLFFPPTPPHAVLIILSLRPAFQISVPMVQVHFTDTEDHKYYALIKADRPSSSPRKLLGAWMGGGGSWPRLVLPTPTHNGQGGNRPHESYKVSLSLSIALFFFPFST